MKKSFIKIVVSLFFLFLSFFFPKDKEILKTIFLLFSYLLVGFPILKKALQNSIRGKLFDENFLMAVATLGAFGIGEIHEAVAVMLFYQIGELFQTYAVDKSRKSIAKLMDICPSYANVYRNSKLVRVSPDEVEIGEEIMVSPGERIPLDGKIMEGNSLLDTKALTGEAVPRDVQVGDSVLSGCINQDGVLRIKVEKEYEDSTVNKILELVENATSRKAKAENFITKFARVYTPLVVLIAILLALCPPLFLENATFSEWIYRALSFLVVSCPCALVISIPLSFFGGIGACSRIGVLVKGSNYLEKMAHKKILVCDKTGTLTEGVFEVQEIESTLKEEELIAYAAYAECFSTHPISLSIKKYYGKEIDHSLISASKESAGKGVLATVQGKRICVGNEKWMEENAISFLPNKKVGTIVYVAVDGIYKGSIRIADRIKEDSYKAISTLRKKGVKDIVLLTGDREEIAHEVSQKLGIHTYYAELLPQEKVEKVEEWMKRKGEREILVFVGDGINDAPVLAISDIGISMGGIGSDVAIEASDIVLMTDELSKVTHTMYIAERTVQIVKQNIFLALFIKIGILFLSACGMTSMWEAVFADVGVSVLAILNALRILRIKQEKG